MRSLIVAALLCLAVGCERSSPASSSSAATPVVDAGAPASSAKKSAHGAGLPFEPGASPTIEDFEVEDLSKFLVANPWCTRVGGGSQIVFNKDGTWARTGNGGAQLGRGTWTLESGRLVLAAEDGGTRRVDPQTGKVNGRVVVSLSGDLHSTCDAP